MAPSHPTPSPQGGAVEVPPPLSNASSSASPAEFATIEDDDKQRMYEKVLYKKVNFQQQVAVLSVDIDNLMTGHAIAASERDGLAAMLVFVEGEAVALKQRVAELGEENATIKRDNAALKQRVTALEEENAAIKEENAAIKKENAAIKEENATMKREFQELKDTVQTLVAASTAVLAQQKPNAS